MIREAVTEDIPRMVEMGCRFRRSTPYQAHLKENPAQMAQLGQQLIAQHTLLVTEREGAIVGMFGYVLFDHFLSGEKVAGEVFWWVEPEHRGQGIRLLKEAERRARLAGAQRMQMIAPSDEVADMYKRMNYQFVEASYQLTL
jgi:GNAT superfamily N-acetyltransferase